jgi:hypothetical protein
MPGLQRSRSSARNWFRRSGSPTSCVAAYSPRIQPRARRDDVGREVGHHVFADQGQRFRFRGRRPQRPREATHRFERVENRSRTLRQRRRANLGDRELEERRALSGIHHQRVGDSPEDGRGNAHRVVALQHRVPLAADPDGFGDVFLRDGLPDAHRQTQVHAERRTVKTDAHAAPLEETAEALPLITSTRSCVGGRTFKRDRLPVRRRFFARRQARRASASVARRTLR